jgi:hypothetical protein
VSDPTLFDDVTAHVVEPVALPLSDGGSARRSDPVSSHITVQSIIADKSMAAHIIRAVVWLAEVSELRHYSDGDSIAVGYTRPVTDDLVWEVLERESGRRMQRNVIARSRGLLERDGWFERVPDVESRTGRPVIAYIPTQLAISYVNKEQ